MDPKQTSPLGNTPAGGQEGQNGQPATPQPVFGTGNIGMAGAAAGTNASPLGGATGDTANAANQKMAGTLGAENLSTGANVSRTMDSLNSKNQSATGTSVFSKHKFDKVQPDGAIILPGSDEPVMVEKRGMSFKTKLKLGVGIGAVVAVGLIVAIIFAFINAPKKDNSAKVASENLTYQQAFNRYANYVLYGTAGTSEPTPNEYQNNVIYQINYSLAHPEITAEDEANYQLLQEDSTYNLLYQLIDEQTFINTAFNYYNTFSEKIGPAIDLTQYPYLQTLILTQANGMNFLNAYFKTEEPTSQSILSKVMNEGLQETESSIDDTYSTLNDSSESGKEYAEQKKNYYKALAQRYNYYNDNNCINPSDNSINSLCVAGLKDIPTGSTSEDYANMIAVTNVTVELAKTDVLRGCFYILKQLPDPSQIDFAPQEVVNEENPNDNAENNNTESTAGEQSQVEQSNSESTTENTQNTNNSTNSSANQNSDNNSSSSSNSDSPNSTNSNGGNNS